MEQSIELNRTTTASETVSTARIMLEAFARRGVRAAFGIPGGLISPLYDALADVPRIRVVTTRHEAMAAFQAMGHAAVTGVPALCLTTGGPGATNALTGIAAAFAEELPLVAVAGEVSAAQMSRGAVQDSTSNALDLVAMMRTVTRWSARVDSPAMAAGSVEQALRHACGPRPGPVFLSLPIHVSSSRTRPFPVALPESPAPGLPNREACREAARRLERARRPLLVLGSGARGAAPEIAALAERLALPVVTTPHAKGLFPESHRLHLGGIGFGGHPSASDYLEAGPDVVCIVGSRLGDSASNGWAVPIAGTEATIQIDRDPWLIGCNYPVTLGIVADAAAAVRAIYAELAVDVARPRPRAGGIRRRNADLACSNAVPLQPARVMAALQVAFPDALFTCDIGEHCAYALHYLAVDRPDQFRSFVGLASMGSGMGAAIGARQALPDRHVVGIVGDGGFMMYAGEVLTCVEHGIDVVLVVINDGRYNIIHHGFETVFGRRPDMLPSRVADLAGVARDLGALGEIIRTPDDLEPRRLRRLAERGRPLVLDVRIDPSLALSVGSRSASLKKAAFGGAA